MKSRKIVITVIGWVCFLLFVIWICFMIKDDKTLYFSEYLLPELGFGYLAVSITSLISVAIAAWRFFKKGKAKLDNNTIDDFLRLIVSCFAFLVFFIIAVDTIKDAENSEIASELLILSDESRVLINEYEQFHGYAKIQVYKINGIIAKEIYTFNEGSYFSDYCLKENKWNYTYNETDKKLMLILRYDEPKDEDGSGFWEEEFTLE